MSISKIMVQCYQLLNDNSYDECLLKAAHQLNSSIKLADLKSIIKNRSILEDVSIDEVGEHAISIQELFDEFQKTAQFKFKQTLNDLVFGIIEALLSLNDNKEKESLIFDVVLLLQQLLSDTNYFNGILKNANVPYYNNIGCKSPFSRYYYIRLSSVLGLYSKKIYQRYSFHLSENTKAHVIAPQSLQAFFQLYSITEWEKTIADEQKEMIDFPILKWALNKSDLTELAVALIQSKALKFESPDSSDGKKKSYEGKIGTMLFAIFNISPNMTSDEFYRAINDIKNRTKPVAFLNTLLKGYKRYVDEDPDSNGGSN